MKTDKLIKFNNQKNIDFLKMMKGKKVCNITRHLQKNPIVNGVSSVLPYIRWNGTTENEYFYAMFYGGMVLMNINERELLLNTSTDFKIIALSKYLESLIKASETTNDFLKKIQCNAEYVKENFQKDLESITFQDIMSILGWKFLSRKVKEDDSYVE